MYVFFIENLNYTLDQETPGLLAFHSTSENLNPWSEA